MRDVEAFDAWLEAELVPQLAAAKAEQEQADEKRRAARLSLPKKIGVFAACFALGLLLDEGGLVLVGFVAPIAIDLYRMSRVRVRDVDVRERFLIPVVRFWDETFAYERWGRAPDHVIRSSRLFERSYDSMSGHDHVTGKAGATVFGFSEIRLFDHVKTRNGEQRRQVFQGVFFVADANKTFSEPVYVVADRTERHLGLAGRALQKLVGAGRGRLVQLEDPAFERHFRVYGDNDLEARLLLTPAFMRRMLRIRENFGCDLTASFVDGRVHLLMELDHDFFEVPTSASRLDRSHLRRWGGELQTLVGLVEDLDLNTRLT